jgi:hypothetical protein
MGACHLAGNCCRHCRSYTPNPGEGVWSGPRHGMHDVGLVMITSQLNAHMQALLDACTLDVHAVHTLNI